MSRCLIAAALLIGVAGMTGCSELKMGGAKAPSGWRLTMMAYTFRNFPMYEGIDKTTAVGLNYLEEFSWHQVGGPFWGAVFNDTASAEVRAGVKKKLKESGVKLVGYYAGELGKDEAASRRTFEFCKEMGVQYIVSEPDPAHLDLVDKLAGEYEIYVAIHNHPRDPAHPEYKNWNPDEVVKLFEGRSKWIGACADTGHWARSGLNTVEAIRKYKGRLVSVHLKDAAKAEKDAPDVVWGTGLADISGVLAELAHQDFRGVFSIEYEANPANNAAEVAQCIKYFNQVTSELTR